MTANRCASITTGSSNCSRKASGSRLGHRTAEQDVRRRQGPFAGPGAGRRKHRIAHGARYLGQWATTSIGWCPAAPVARPFRLKIERRTDFAQHFLTSAPFRHAATAPCRMRSAVQGDQRHRPGSGFSFTDIAADRAGDPVRRTLVTADDRCPKTTRSAGIAGRRIMPRRCKSGPRSA